VRIEVLYFAQIKDATGTDSESLMVDAGATVADVVRILRERPAWRLLSELPLTCAVNEAVVGSEHVLHDKDVVALLPPVSGG